MSVEKPSEIIQALKSINESTLGRDLTKCGRMWKAYISLSSLINHKSVHPGKSPISVMSVRKPLSHTEPL